MNKIYFLYGDDETIISEKEKDILAEVNSNNHLNLLCEKIFLNTVDEIDIFLNREPNLSLFPQLSVMKVFLTVKSFKLLEKEIERFMSLIAMAAGFKTLILILHIEKFDKNIKNYLSNSLLYKELKNGSEIREYIKPKYWQKEEIRARVVQLSEKHKLIFENEALNIFVECFKEKVDLIETEIIKLQLYVYPSNTILVKLVKELYFSTFNIDEIYTTLLQSKFNSLINIVESFNITSSVMYVLIALQNKFREALQIKLLFQAGVNSFQMSKNLGIHQFRLENELKQLKTVSLNHVKYLIDALSDLEFKLKNGVIKEKEVLNILFLKIAAYS